MIKNEDAIKTATPILEVVRPYVALRKAGTNWTGCCPFHDEKTPSFTVSPAKGIYKCFGCGAAGDGAQFLIEHKHITYPEALEEMAKISNLNIEYAEGDNHALREAMKAAKERKASVGELLLQIQRWYWNESWAHISFSDEEAVIFAGRSYQYKTIRRFGLSWAPKGNLLTKALKELGIADRQQELLQVGIIRNGNASMYDYYRERSLFPIRDERGLLLGWGGRKPSDDNDKKNPKYINPSESDLYDKSRVLYGLHEHRKHITTQSKAILVEGYTDVITLSEFGITTAIASCGTALTTEQAKLIKKYADEVIILRDGDEAGRKAAQRDTETCIDAGLMAKVALLPDGEDPDSFIRKHDQVGFEFWLEETAQDALVWLIMLEWHEKDVFKQERAFNLAGQLIAKFESTTLRENYIRELCKKNRMGSVRKQLNDRISHYSDIAAAKDSWLNNQQERDVIEYGLYEKDNRYFVCNDPQSEGTAVSNFTIRPIMLIIGANMSQRLVEIRNCTGKQFIINCDSTVFTSLSKFKEATERYGAFVFSGKPEYYERVKIKVYDQSKDCFPINVMGQHRDGFYTWGNGISIEGSFKEVDEYGIVEYGGTRYFLPAFSRIQENIKSDDMEEQFEYEKRFAFYPQADCIPFEDWALQMHDVHSGNGMMAVAYACAALFRDIIFQKFQFFPHLNAFGPSGSGKTFMARSVMALFGRSNQHDPFNLASGTPVAFKRRLAQAANAIIWFDEYSNDIDFRRVEALKGAYDGAGHEKGIASQDNRTVTTKVKSALMLTGQQQPTKDIALFKRVISLNCRSGRNTVDRQQRAARLKKLEESGQFTQLTQYLLGFRQQVDDAFAASFESGRALVNTLLQREGRVVEDRIVANHLIPVAVLDVLNKIIPIGFDFDEFFQFTYNNIIEQSESIYNEDELSIFWRIVEYLHQKGLADPRSGIHHGSDILVQQKVEESYQNELNKKEKKDSVLKRYDATVDLVYIRFPTVHPEYQERHSRQRGKNGLDLGALQYYLRTSDAYQGMKRAKKFGDKSYSCYVFDLAQLPIELPLSVEVINNEGAEELPY